MIGNRVEYAVQEMGAIYLKEGGVSADITPKSSRSAGNADRKKPQDQQPDKSNISARAGTV